MKAIGGGSEGRLGLNNLFFYEFTFPKHLTRKLVFQNIFLKFFSRVKFHEVGLE